MSKCYRAMILTAAALLLLAGASQAAIPTRITVEGKLTNTAGDPVPAGLKSFTFKIFDTQTGGTEIWPAGPGEIQPLSTDSHGLWTAEIGLMIPLTAAVFSGGDRWLETTVNDGVHPSETLTRVRLNTNPYALQSDQSANASNLGGQPPSSYAPAVHTHSVTTITDEPGIVSGRNAGPVSLTVINGPMTDIVTVSITTPSGGYVVLNGACTAEMHGTTGTNYAGFQIDETAGGVPLPGYYVWAGNSGGTVTNQYWTFPVSVQRVYAVAAGTHVYRLEGANVGGAPGAVTDVYYATLTAAFYPTAYGTVAP